jgi:hypothetical protein
MLTVAKLRRNFLRNLSISLPICTVSPSQRPLSSCLVPQDCDASANCHLKLKTVCCFEKLALVYQTRRCHQTALHSRLYLVMLPVAAILDWTSLSAATVHATYLVLLVVNWLFIVTGAWLCSLTMNLHFNPNPISGFAVPLYSYCVFDSITSCRFGDYRKLFWSSLAFRFCYLPSQFKCAVNKTVCRRCEVSGSY